MRPSTVSATTEQFVDTERGSVMIRLAEAAGAERAVLLVGGVGGGFDSPAGGLYGRLAAELPREGLSVLRLRYRRPTQLPEAVFDISAGLHHLAKRGARRIALVGHSLGGAAVITAGALDPAVSTVIAISAQRYGADAITRVAPRPLLLVHGRDDPVLPATCSESLYELAGEPKELRLIVGGDHVLDRQAEEVTELVRRWLIEKT
jgi:hypothetical protein